MRERKGALAVIVLFSLSEQGFSSSSSPSPSSSVIPWTELSDGEFLMSIATRRAVVDGRTVHYPAPTRELAASLEAATSGVAAADGTNALVAFRHLAEARRELGDRAGAEKALSEWASRSGGAAPAAWAEAARWGARYRSWTFAFACAAKALPGLSDGEKRALATERIGWAEAHPDVAEPLSMKADRAALFPRDPAFTEDWIRSLEAAGRLHEAEDALRMAAALPDERRAVLASDLKGTHGDPVGAYAVLEAFVGDASRRPDPQTLQVFARRADEAARAKLDGWRFALERSFDPKAFLLLARYFEGKSRGDLAFELLTQIERRHAASFDRGAWLLTARLWESVDGVPEAFRARLAAASTGTPAEKLDDLETLAELALKAGGRPLAWGVYNDESYRWAARIDVTPGFLTGGLSLLLTGFEKERALAELEARRLPDRTFAAARLLAAELEKRAPKHPKLPGLTVAIMARHVERGEGDSALKLLPKADAGDEATRAEARRVVLLALRQTKPQPEREAALWSERLKLLAPAGSMPTLEAPAQAREGEGRPAARDVYGPALREAITRLSGLDRSHRLSLTLLLGELDRLPGAESLWRWSADQIGGWKLDDGLDARYRAALESFGGPEWWNRLARWYARRQKTTELKTLADDVVARFRAADIFSRDPNILETVPAEAQPNPYVRFGDYLRLKALDRFPASPEVLRQAESHLILRSVFDNPRWSRPVDWKERGVVPDAFLKPRQDALLFEDSARRQRLLDDFVKRGRLEAFLVELEALPVRTPVENVLLLDGWARLSQFERATPFADRLAEAYPGNGPIAQQAMSLHRSLSGLDAAHASAVERIARAVAPALEDPAAVYTSAGETWQDLDRPGPAGEAWRNVMAASPRDPARILEVATIFWDYGRMAEALETLESGRARLGRPGMHAFEAGILREEVRDLPGAVDEYLSALRGEDGGGRGRWSWGDPRASQRLARLMGRPRVQELVGRRIAALRPGEAGDEETLVSLLSLLTLAPEEADAWDDWMDRPNDAVGRERRADAREGAQTAEGGGLLRVGTALVAKTHAMISAATRSGFLGALRQRRGQILDRRFAPDPARDADFDDALLAREAALAPTEEKRIEAEIARAHFLSGHGRADQAAALWKSLGPRIEALPEAATKMHHLAGAAGFAEDTKGDANGLWAALGKRYPWSLGVFEDRLAFLFRSGRASEGLDLLEKTAGAAAAGHRERLTERLAKESLDRGDLARAQRALRAMAALALDDDKRIAAASLDARLSLRSGAPVDLVASGRKAAAALPENKKADLWAAFARAASEEGRNAEAVDLFIEALNLRLDRGFLGEVCRLAVASGREKHLLGFFETQRAHSPRDVRWAVAVREIRTFAGDLDGAIAVSKEAVLVAPERESQHRETVALLERADRFREAADFLGAWAKARAGDENVASWRASLYVKAGDEGRALEVERASLAAWLADAKEQGRAVPAVQAAERRARIARRFLALGRPAEAWAVAVPGGNFRRVSEVQLSHGERTEIALRADKLTTLVRAFGGDKSFRNEAAEVIARIAKPEQLDELQKQLVIQMFLEGKREEGGGKPDGRSEPVMNVAALNRWWDFAGRAGLHRFSEEVARRLLASRHDAGAPWSANPPVAFLRSIRPIKDVPPASGASKGHTIAFSNSDFLPEWTSYLVSRDRLALLVPILEARVAELQARVSTGPLHALPLPFARWFPVEAFARLAETPEHAGWKAHAASWFRTEEAYARFEAATGGAWDLRPLVNILDDDTRGAWLALLSARGTAAAARLNPLEAQRRTAVSRASSSLAALVEGKKDAASSADIVRLRGPRSLGDVLTPDPKWTWPEFSPRPSGETGEDSFTGGGADAMRLPGRLWGARPGDAWYVLEALSRWRERAVDAPWVPLESPSRGGETDKTLLAVRTAEGLGDVPLALRLDETYFADLGKRDRLLRRLRLLVKDDPAAGRRAADDLLGTEIRSRQNRADPETWTAWQSVAKHFGLTAPLEQLDAKKSVSPGLLAWLWDVEGPKAAARFTPADSAAFRVALAARWEKEGETLSRDRTIRYLDDLWSVGSARYPDRAARKLGPFWAAAGDVLAPVDVRLRADALASVRALPDPNPLRNFAAKTLDRREPMELLLLKAELASGDEAAALNRLDHRLTSTAPGASPLFWSAAAVPAAPPPAAEEGEEGAGVPDAHALPAPTASGAPSLVTWLKVFRDSTRGAALTLAEEKLRARVKKELEAGPAPLAAWLLSLELATTPEAQNATIADLEKSWARGEWPAPSGDRAAIAKALVARDPAAAGRWFQRIEEPRSFAEARVRADILLLRKLPDEARTEWVHVRARLSLTRTEERDAFDAWRRIPGVPAGRASGAPAAWEIAAAFWTKKGPDIDFWGDTLATHLARHPYDFLSARVVLRSLAPAREAVAAPAWAALGGREDVPGWRVLRFERTRSFRSARAAVPSLFVDANELARRRFPKAEVDGLLADVARVAAESGDKAAAAQALAALAERKAPALAALKGEVESLSRRNLPRPDVTRTTAGRFAELRPRDLTWDLYARVLNAENVP